MVPLSNLLTLNPEIEKLNYFNKDRIVIENDFVGEEMIDLKLSYQFTGLFETHKSDELKRRVLGLFNSLDKDSKISSEVLAQCFSFIEDLYPSALEQLKINEVYSTPYGTVVFEWEKNENNVFSLEIGAEEIGYFIEVEGTDEKQIDSLLLEDSKKEILQDLSGFLSI